MKMPKPVEGLKSIETRVINAEINGIIVTLADGSATARGIANRLHRIAVQLQPIDEKLTGGGHA